MAKSQIEILTEAISNLYLQLSASLAREDQLREVNAQLANQIAKDIEAKKEN